MKRVLGLLAALVLLVALVGGGLVHAIVPHDDGDNHHDAKSVVWGSLHSALQHEDKSFALLAVVFTYAVGVVVLVTYAFRTELLFEAVAADSRLQHMRRGAAKYRRFG